ncbi:MAG: hypothetical protein M3R17_09400 [Bacteroidota bacterium]|nr:hypothetical protein [Bacteroidota bacterium]
MNKLVSLFVIVSFPLCAFLTDNVPCGNANYFRIGIDDLPGFNCCISDSFRLEKKEIDRDTLFEQVKGQFLFFDMYSTESNANQHLYVMVEDKATGKIIKTRLTCENSSTYFSALLFLNKLRHRSKPYSNYSLTVMKIVNEGKDTLRCELGSFTLKNLK